VVATSEVVPITEIELISTVMISFAHLLIIAN